MADSLINITIGLHEAPALVADRLLQVSENESAREGIVRLANELISVASGARDGKVLARVDSLTRGAAAQTVQCDNATATVGDTLVINVPNVGGYTLTAVAGAASAVLGQYSIDTSDAAMATSLAAAVNGLPGLKYVLSASAATDTVTVTARELGTWAHTITLKKNVTNAGTLTLGGAVLAGGDDILDRPAMTVTFGTANITADDTISIGGVKYTWKASASNVNEITLSTTETTAATNFATAINADARWTGLISASVNSAIVTLTWLGDPRLGQHIVMDYTEVNATSVVLGGTVIIGTGEAFVIDTTATGSSTTRVYGGRGAP